MLSALTAVAVASVAVMPMAARRDSFSDTSIVLRFAVQATEGGLGIRDDFARRIIGTVAPFPALRFKSRPAVASSRPGRSHHALDRESRQSHEIISAVANATISIPSNTGTE